MTTYLVTGGAGFIGSAFLNLFVPAHPEIRFVNLDKMGYAANPENLAGLDVETLKVDLADLAAVQDAVARRSRTRLPLRRREPRRPQHLRAPGVRSLERRGHRQPPRSRPIKRRRAVPPRLHRRGVRLPGRRGRVHGDDALRPHRAPTAPARPPAITSVRAYARTFGMRVTMTNCSNNYGPRHFPEKLIPLMILNALDGKSLPVYGKGDNVRDWLYVDDHARAIWEVAERGRPGETYCVGGNQEKTNIDVVRAVCRAVGRNPEDLVVFVKDRPGHDHRYAIDASKLKDELGWEPAETFETGLAKTVKWYLDNPGWVERVRSGAYREWVAQQYGATA